MAEVIAVIASGIAIEQAAGQLVVAALKTRKLWEQIQNASERVRYLLEDIDIYSTLLKQNERNFENGSILRGSFDDLVTQKISRACQRAIKQLEEVCQDLQKNLDSPKRSKRALGGIRVVLKDNSMKQYEERLKDTLYMLHMVHQLHQSESMRALPDLIARRMIEMHDSQIATAQLILEPIDNDEDDGVQSIDRSGTEYRRQINHRKRKTELGMIDSKRNNCTKPAHVHWDTLFGMLSIRIRGDSVYQATLQAPRWLAQKAWNFHVERELSGWKYLFRTRNIVPRDCEAFEYTRKDDVEALTRLFIDGRASPHDVTQYHTSLLDIAVMYNCYEVCRKLLDLGADTNDLIQNDGNPHHSDYIYGYSSVLVHSGSITMSSLLIDHGIDIDAFGPEPHRILENSYGGDTVYEHIRNIQTRLFPQYHRLPAHDRYRVSWLVTRNGAPDIDAATCRYLIHPEGRIVFEDLEESSKSGYSILILSAAMFGCLSVSAQTPSSSRLLVVRRGWRDFLKELLHLGPDLHTLHDGDKRPIWFPEPYPSPKRSYTPMWSFVVGVLNGIWMRNLPAKALTDTLKTKLLHWLCFLRDEGVDLMKYGLEEKRRFSHGQVCHDVGTIRRWIETEALPETADIPLRVVAFDVAAEPEGWKFWWVLEYEVFAGEFWTMVENPPGVMPGGWVE